MALEADLGGAYGINGNAWPTTKRESDQDQHTACVPPSETTPVNKRKSDEFGNPFSEMQYDKYHLYHLTVHKMLNGPPTRRKVEPPLLRQVCIYNTLKQLEQDLTAPVEQTNHSTPKRPTLSDHSPQSNPTDLPRDVNPSYSGTFSSSSNPLLSSSQIPINIEPSNIDVSPTTGLQQQDDFYSDMEKGEVKHENLLLCEIGLTGHSCSFDHTLHSAMKDTSRSMEELDSLMQVLVGM